MFKHTDFSRSPRQGGSGGGGPRADKGGRGGGFSGGPGHVKRASSQEPGGRDPPKAPRAPTHDSVVPVNVHCGNCKKIGHPMAECPFPEGGPFPYGGR